MTIEAGNVQFSFAQLEAIWIQAGGNPVYSPMAAAISQAESGGNSANAGFNSNGTIDRGLWQINSTHGSQSSFDIMTNARAAVAISNNGTNWRPWCTAYSDGACGSKGGTYLGAGAPYQKYLGDIGVAGGSNAPPPDYTAPINGTNAAGNTTNPTTGTTSTADTTGFSCGWIENLVTLGACSAVTGEAEKLTTQIIKFLLGSVLNPLIQITAGIMGMTGGALMVGGGMYMIVRESSTYQKARSMGQQAAVTAVAPEAGAAAGSIQRTPQTPQQAQQQRAAYAQHGELFRRQQAQAQQMTTDELLRQEAMRYGRVVAE